MGERQQAPLNPALTGPSSIHVARVAFCVGVSLGGRPVGFVRGVSWSPEQQNVENHVATVFACTRKTKATWAKLWPSTTARMASRYLTRRQLATVLGRLQVVLHGFTVGAEMVKRPPHLGPFLHSEMALSWGGRSPMCGGSSIHLQKIFFLKSIAKETRRQETHYTYLGLILNLPVAHSEQ